MTLLTGSNIGMQFGDRWLYKNVDFKLENGHVLALIGDNGVGKTTLLRALLGQLPLSVGQFDWETRKWTVRLVTCLNIAQICRRFRSVSQISWR